MNTDHILFLCAGAFHRSKPSDLLPELQVGVRVWGLGYSFTQIALFMLSLRTPVFLAVSVYSRLLASLTGSVAHSGAG